MGVQSGHEDKNYLEVKTWKGQNYIYIVILIIKDMPQFSTHVKAIKFMPELGLPLKKKHTHTQSHKHCQL